MKVRAEVEVEEEEEEGEGGDEGWQAIGKRPTGQSERFGPSWLSAFACARCA
jgi:hypothetical protein